MADDKDDKKDDAEIEKLEDKLDDIKDDIQQTPEEDKDATWRTTVNSALAKVSADLASLVTAQQGASPEMAEMRQQITTLTTLVEKLALTPPTSSPRKEEEKPSLETPKETSSDPRGETPKEPPPAKQPERKAKVWL